MGISQIRNLSETEFEIDYEDESKVVATLFLKIDPDADVHVKRLVNAKVIIYNGLKNRSEDCIVQFRILLFMEI